MAAAQALGAIGDAAAIEPLSRALADDAPVMRMAAAQALGAIGDAAAIQALGSVLRDDALGVRMAAVRALGKIGGPAAAALLGLALRDDESSVREAAVEALAAIKTPRVRSMLQAALKDRSAAVCRAAMWALSEIGDAQAIGPLSVALNDADPSVRGAAATALGKIRDPRAVELLSATLSDANLEVRSAAALALGKISDPRGLQPLITALHEQSFDLQVVLWFARRKFWLLRHAAVAALGREATAQVVAPLQEALNDTHGMVRAAAAAALQQIEARVGRLRANQAEQQQFKARLSALPIVDPARWVQLHSARYGPLSPGDDSENETLIASRSRLVHFLVEEQPTLKISWGTGADAIVVEYADPATAKLQRRLVVLRQAEPAGYLCYLAWQLVQR
jgi:HEAT repeat protein